jgi:hypothetical protein
MKWSADIWNDLEAPKQEYPLVVAVLRFVFAIINSRFIMSYYIVCGSVLERLPNGGYGTG